jgi:type II secretory pathway predicted ATPase ExeA
MDLTPLGLRAMPFTREHSVAERFTYPPQDEAVEGLLAAVKKRMSAALIAPAGTGKTVVLRTVRDKLPQARYRVRYVKVTELSKRDLCKEVAAVCGLTPAGTYPALVRKLQDAFSAEYATDGLRPVLLLDEAHDLHTSSLAMLRLLTNFDMDSRLVLSLILAGQPPLRQMLARAEAHALAQRLVHVASLRLLSREEVRAYVQHRCRIAGATDDIFDAEAHEALFEVGSGNLRATDHLALKAIESCARAGTGAVAAKDILEARQSLCL